MPAAYHSRHLWRPADPRSSARGLALALVALLALLPPLPAGADSISDLQLQRAIEAHNRQAGAEEQVTCRRERQVGTYIMRRVCRTSGQFRTLQQDAQDAMREAQQYQELLDAVPQTPAPAAEAPQAPAPPGPS